MANETILSRVKLAIRRSHNKLDSDLQADIDACLQDMSMRGMKSPNPDNALVFSAIKLYCQSTTSKDPAEGALFYARYESLRDSILLSPSYDASKEDQNV